MFQYVLLTVLHVTRLERVASVMTATLWKQTKVDAMVSPHWNNDQSDVKAGWHVCLSKTVPQIEDLFMSKKSLYFTLKWSLNIWYLKYYTTTLIKWCAINAACCLDYNPITQLVEICHWLSWVQGNAERWNCLEALALVWGWNIFQLLTKFIVIITQWSLYVPACAANCTTCDTAGTCSICNDGYIVKADKSGCDGKSILK